MRCLVVKNILVHRVPSWFCVIIRWVRIDASIGSCDETQDKANVAETWGASTTGDDTFPKMVLSGGYELGIVWRMLGRLWSLKSWLRGSYECCCVEKWKVVSYKRTCLEMNIQPMRIWKQ
jgi:hypothetical protein